MNNKVILSSVVVLSLLMANTFWVNADDLFGSLGLGSTTGTTQTKAQTNKQQANNLFGTTSTTGANKQQADNLFGTTKTQTKAQTNKQQAKTQLKKLWYTVNNNNISFDVNYLPKQSNFIIEFTGNRQNNIVLSWISITNLSGKVLDLWGLLNKMNFIIVGGGNIKKISLSEVNKNGIDIAKDDKVYLQGQLNDIDKQVLATLLNNQNTFKVIFKKWSNVNELIPSKEGILKNNATLEVNYLYAYDKVEPKIHQVTNKIVKLVKHKETWTTEVTISILIIFMMILSFYYVKTWKAE